MVHFRKRLSDSVLAEINELVVQQASRSSDDGDDHENSTRGGEQDGEVDAGESE